MFSLLDKRPAISYEAKPKAKVWHKPEFIWTDWEKWVISGDYEGVMVAHNNNNGKPTSLVCPSDLGKGFCLSFSFDGLRMMYWQFDRLYFFDYL